VPRLGLGPHSSGFVSLLFKPSHTLLPHSLFFFLPPSPFSPLATYQLSSNSVYQLFRTMVSIPCSLPVIPRALSHHPCQSHNSPESSPHPPSMENDSHQDAHVHGLRLVLGSILAPVRPLLPSYAHILTFPSNLLTHRSGPRHPRTRVPTRRPARRPRLTTGTIRGQ